MTDRRIGTSGWNYKHWAGGVFYPARLPARKWLSHYATAFDAVELNVTFYRSVPRSTFEGWRAGTPREFAFVAKGPRFITHLKRLAVERESMEMFLDAARGLGPKLAGVLWQLPPRFRADLDRLERFLEISRSGRLRRAFEFRDPSWFCPEVYALLAKHGAALCIASARDRPCPREITSDFLYLRFHGGAHGTGYADGELREWAAFAREFPDRDLFAFFNNDPEGHAVRDAKRFRELLEK
jgi:uncharacterized protein YecE (DUF72 family)